MKQTILFSLLWIFLICGLSCSKRDYSNPLEVDVGLPAPTGLKVVSMTETAAQLQWEFPAPDANYPNVKYQIIIERSTDGANFTLVDSTDASTNTKSIMGIYLSGVTYSFRLSTRSAYSHSTSTSPVSKSYTLEAPTSLSVTLTETAATLTWKSSSIIATGFIIERSTDGANFAAIDSTDATYRARTIASNYLPGMIYIFRVYAKSIYSRGSASVPVPAIVGDISKLAVSGGTYQMGSTSGILDELPVHSVAIGDFYIDSYEITYVKWSVVQLWAVTHGYTDLPTGQNGYNPAGSNNPVTNVSWYDVIKWCNARSEKDGMIPVYYTDNSMTTVYRTGSIDLTADAVKWTANGYRLPTEAEWEFAARGGTKSQGYTYSGSNIVGDVAWYQSNSGNATHTVGQKTINELGLFDMSGNVLEWCWDWYGGYGSSAQTNPRGATSGTYRVLRGGSFDNFESNCRSTLRNANFPSARYGNIGLRCVQK